MWNPFRKKDQEQEKGPRQQSPQQSNRVDELEYALEREGCAGELEGELMKLNYPSLSLAEQESWWHLSGIVAFQKGRDEEALSRFKEGYERFPRSALIRFSLGQQYIRLNDIETGFALFRECRFPEIPREYAFTQARYAYLWNRYDEGRQFISPFLEAYKKLKILDDHFLYVRGLPFFNEWWSYLAAFSVLSGQWEELEEVTQWVTKKCHDYDFDTLQVELAAHRDDKPELLIPALEKRLAGIPSGSFPTGSIRMNLAVAKARNASTLGSAEEVLDSVELAEDGRAWLKDIRTLAKAQAAHRFHQPALENEHIAAFLARQPMLFEPNIALDFHLLRYQELLKPHPGWKSFSPAWRGTSRR
jgi:hypothetical protein